VIMIAPSGREAFSGSLASTSRSPRPPLVGRYVLGAAPKLLNRPSVTRLQQPQPGPNCIPAWKWRPAALPAYRKSFGVESLTVGRSS
jgi:hypothetical protein